MLSDTDSDEPSFDRRRAPPGSTRQSRRPHRRVILDDDTTDSSSSDSSRSGANTDDENADNAKASNEDEAEQSAPKHSCLANTADGIDDGLASALDTLVLSPVPNNTQNITTNEAFFSSSTPAQRRMRNLQKRRARRALRLQGLDDDDSSGESDFVKSDEEGTFELGDGASENDKKLLRRRQDHGTSGDDEDKSDDDDDDIFDSSYYFANRRTAGGNAKQHTNSSSNSTRKGTAMTNNPRQPILLGDTSSDDDAANKVRGSRYNIADSNDDDDASSSSSGVTVASSSIICVDNDEESDDSFDQLFRDGLTLSSPSHAKPDVQTEPTTSASSSPRATTSLLSPLEPFPDRISTTSNPNGEAEGGAWVYDDATYYLGKDSTMVQDADDWPDVRLPSALYQRLYPHQKIGVQWMASMHEGGIGGILGDDMGLGKTFQTLAYLGGLMKSRTIRNALIICPVSVLRTWEREGADILKKGCVPKITISVVSSDVKKQRRFRLLQEALDCPRKYPHLIITSYGLVTSSTLDFVSQGGKRAQWDYVVCDEGHKLKNQNTQVSKACRRICRDGDTRRLLLTGTPIQNNLKELWALFDFATSGKVLGPLRRFQNSYGDPIEAGRMKNATDWTIRTAEKANKELQAKLRPHFLQRLKSNKFKDMLPTKRELVVFTHLSSKQRSMYEQFLAGGMVASILTGETASPLEAITWLKKLCGHPYLVDKTGHSSICDIGRKALVRDSSKLHVLHDLLIRLNKSGHRALVFSQSTKMLDIIQRVMSVELRLSRIDGSTKEKDRQRSVDAFNSDDSKIDVMLLSTKAAGIGLTLTGADRAVIFDPSWNPSDDSQAVDRCFRIGQTKNVTVYRFITSGAVEEAMYKKVCHKDGIRRTVTGTSGSATERHFDKDDLRKIFNLGPAGESEMLEMFNCKQPAFDEDADPNATSTSFVLGASGKPSFLETHPAVVGLLSHDQLYTKTVIEIEDAPETPFAGTPLQKQPKMGRSQRALAGNTSTKLDFGGVIDEDVVEDNADPPASVQAIDLTDTNKRKPLVRMVSNQEDQSEDDERVEDKKTLKPATTKSNFNPKSSPPPPFTEPAPSIPASTRKEGLIDFGKIVGDVDEHIICGRTEAAMETLLDVLESDQLKGQDKLSMHKKIAALALQLGWL